MIGEIASYEWQDKWFEFTERERQILAVMVRN
jgi:hypothetical protein